jgi:tyrosyl-tRNA synthetase
MPTYSRLVTRWTPAEISTIESGLKDGTLHPRDAKMKLAREVTATFYGEDEADGAQDAFINLFQKRDIPDDIPEFSATSDQTLIDILVASGMVASRSDGRRLIEQKGVKLDGKVLTDWKAQLSTQGVLQVGKRHFLRLKIT